MLRGDREPDHLVIVGPAGQPHTTPFAVVIVNNAYGADVGPAGLGRCKRIDDGVPKGSILNPDSGRVHGHASGRPHRTAKAPAARTG